MQTGCQQNLQNKTRRGTRVRFVAALGLRQGMHYRGTERGRRGGGRWCRRLRPSTAFFSGRPDQRPAQSPTLISAQKHNCSDCKGIGHEGDCCFSNSKCYIFFFLPSFSSLGVKKMSDPGCKHVALVDIKKLKEALSSNALLTHKVERIFCAFTSSLDNLLAQCERKTDIV